jgi:hypothetical protein
MLALVTALSLASLDGRYIVLYVSPESQMKTFATVKASEFQSLSERSPKWAHIQK